MKCVPDDIRLTLTLHSVRLLPLEGGGVGGHRGQMLQPLVREEEVDVGDLQAGSGGAERRGQRLHKRPVVALVTLPPSCHCCLETF